MIKVNPTEETKILSKFPYPSDPSDRWNEPIAIIDTRKPIHFQQVQLFPSEGKNLLGRIHARFFNWLSKNAD